MKVGSVVDGETLCLCVSLFETGLVDVAFEVSGTLGAAIWPISTNAGVAVEPLCPCCSAGAVSPDHLL